MLETVSVNRVSLTFSIPRGAGPNTYAAGRDWADWLDDLNFAGSSSRLRYILHRIRFPRGPGWGHDKPKPVPTVTVPAPGSILLGSVGLLLVRALRLRRVIA